MKKKSSPKKKKADERKAGTKKARTERTKPSVTALVSRASHAKKSALALTLRKRALIAIGLSPDEPTPPASLSEVLKEVALDHKWAVYLLQAADEGSKRAAKLYYELSPAERAAVTIDDCVRAAGGDWHKVFGALAEQVSKIEGGKASMLAAARSPAMMKAAASWGETYDGHQDRKMILQTAGVAPVPKNQVTNIRMGDNAVLDARRQTVIAGRVPTLEEVVRDVDDTVYGGQDARDKKPGAVIEVAEAEVVPEGDPMIVKAVT